jgi:MFS family permease
VRNYRLYFWGQTISVAGTWMQTLALAFLVLDLGGGGTALGLTTAARLAPFLLLGPWGGVIADRADKRRLLYLTQSASAAVAIAFTVLIVIGAATIPLVMVLSLLAGCLTVFDNPARQAMISELVPGENLANAVTLGSVSVNLSRVLGAAAGGAVVATVGLPAAFAINAASFVAVLASLALMRATEMYPSARAERAPGQVREGLRHVRRTPVLLWPLVMLTVTGTVAYEFPVTLPLLARGAFGGEAATYGAMSAVMALGAVVGGLVAATRGNPRRPASLAVASMAWGLAILAAALAPSLPLELVALLFVGYGSITFNSTAKTALQLASEPTMRGRVMALWALAWGGSTVIGAPLVGWIAQELGSRASLVAGAASALLLGGAMYPLLRRDDQPDRASPTRSREASCPAVGSGLRRRQ